MSGSGRIWDENLAGEEREQERHRPAAAPGRRTLTGSQAAAGVPGKRPLSQGIVTAPDVLLRAQAEQGTPRWPERRVGEQVGPGWRGGAELAKGDAHVARFDRSIRAAITVEVPRFEHSIRGRDAAQAQATLGSLVAHLRDAQGALADARVAATADTVLADDERPQQESLLREMAKREEYLRSLPAMLANHLSPGWYRTPPHPRTQPPAEHDLALIARLNGEGTVRILQCAGTIQAIVGPQAEKADADRRRAAAALVVTVPRDEPEAGLLREMVAERGVTGLEGPDLFDHVAGEVGQLMMGPAGRFMLPAYLEQSGAKQIAKDIIASIQQSPAHAAAVFREWWQQIEDDWQQIVATMLGMIAAEAIAAVLVVSPDPAARMAGIIIQSVLLGILLAGATYEVVLTVQETAAWLAACGDANGNRERIADASRAFCRAVLHALLAIISALGARGAARFHARTRPNPKTDIVAFARSLQGTEDYPGVDTFEAIMLRRGTIVYGGVPGQSSFYADAASFERAGGVADVLARGTQVMPHRTLGYRPAAKAYRLREDVEAAIGIAKANILHGPGTMRQVVLRDFAAVLEEIAELPMSK